MKYLYTLDSCLYSRSQFGCNTLTSLPSLRYVSVGVQRIKEASLAQCMSRSWGGALDCTLYMYNTIHGVESDANVPEFNLNIADERRDLNITSHLYLYELFVASTTMQF